MGKKNQPLPEISVAVEMPAVKPPRSAAASVTGPSPVGPCCGACCFWIDRTLPAASGEPRLGGCHRLPPVACAAGGPVLSDRERYLGTWPVTMAGDTCGEFRARE